MKKNLDFSYDKGFNTTMQPGAFTKFKRTNIVWQFFRLIATGIKILKILLKGHH